MSRIAFLFCAMGPFLHAKTIYHPFFKINLPWGWQLKQKTVSETSQAWLFGNSKSEPLTLTFSKEPLENSKQTSALSSFTFSSRAFNWRVESFLHQLAIKDGTQTITTFKFMAETDGGFLTGFTHSSQQKNSERNALAFIEALEEGVGNIQFRSLTPDDPFSKKYYLGIGRASNTDPMIMQNEVKYDVQHTHDIFTQKWGGNYIGKTLIGRNEATRNIILKSWQDIFKEMTFDDMYVQYSSSHGSEVGLHFQNDMVRYDEIRDNVLQMPAREIVVFIMACHSGALVNSFKNRETVWRNWNKRGKTLFVMASSHANSDSIGGPNVDPEEKAKSTGSAGSAFGHALWKALIGHADGALDGVKDGFISLGELESYTIHKTQQVSSGSFQHTPVVTGSYSPSIIMNQVPPKEVAAMLEKKGAHLTGEAIWKQVQQYDDYLLQHP